MRKVIRATVESVCIKLVCMKCERVAMYHAGYGLKETDEEVLEFCFPSQSWNGWYVGTLAGVKKEICPSCFGEAVGKIRGHQALPGNGLHHDTVAQFALKGGN